MELTMTLTVTPEQAAAIANLLADTELANRTVQAMRSNTPAPAPAATPIPAAIPQQNPAAPQTMPTAAPVQPSPASAAMPVSTAAPTPAAAPVAPSDAPVQQTPPAAGIPTQVRTYSVNDLAIACRPLMEAGKQPELQALLTEFGAPAGLASVPENRRSEFAGRLRQMGGQI
ncbi:hypothetical protein [Ruminococcus sp.]|uniref:hypothetical protein n=1 Tax=Ruminococcus sp. TaxID=41978 RepID=UPI0025EDBC20|nr:hypothetical protein [Ruminococcus sp.]